MKAGGKKRKSTQLVTRTDTPVTLKTLSEYLGLSPASISLVLNDSPLAKRLSEDTRERILDAVKTFKYRPNYFARYLNMKRSYLIGIMVPEMGEGYVAAVLAGIEHRFFRERYFYFVASHQWSPELIERTPDMLTDRGAEGIIFLNTPVSREPGIPSVAIAGRRPFPSMWNILIDNELGARLGLEHLIQLGHRRIAFFKGPVRSADTEERWRSICRTAAEHNVEIDPDLVIQLDLDEFLKARESNPSLRKMNVHDEGYYFAQKLMERRVKFSALFAFNDVSAIGAISAFRDAGLRVPSDVSVIGFDDVQAASFVEPRLTTIRQPLFEMGELAASKLLLSLNSHDIEPERFLVQPVLVARDSTAPPPLPL